MGLTLIPIMGCNMGCKGCYEGEIFRQNGNRPEPYDLDAMIAMAQAVHDDEIRNHREPGVATLHGGEFTLLPLDDMRKLFEAMRQQNRAMSMQTNGSMVTAKLIELLREFRVAVGFSINGPDVLNRDRRAGSVVTGTAADAVTDKLTARIHQNVERCREAKLEVGIIVTLSQTNAGTDEILERLIEWAIDMGERLGIWDFRFNTLGQNDQAIEGNVELSPARATEVYRRLAEACFADPRRMWLPFREMVDNLLGFGIAPCWLAPCDPFNTDAVLGVTGDGTLGNCQRPSHDGISYVRTEQVNNVRQTILGQIPMAEGGCGGCRYWRVCYGGCPGEGVGGDWRNKTRFCEMYLGTYGLIEQRLRGLIPNVQPVPDWATNDEGDMLRTRRARKPRTSAIRGLDDRYVKEPSTWMKPGNIKRSLEAQ